MRRVPLKSVLVTVGLAGVLFAAGMLVGRMGQPSAQFGAAGLPDVSASKLPTWSPGSILRLSPLVQDDAPERDPNDPRELIPMPGPGSEPQPGQGGQPQECGIYLYQDGQLYQLPPGQLPGQGGGSPELIPLNPVPGGPGGPSTPSAPPPPPGIES
jgi:hypothetical protein